MRLEHASTRIRQRHVDEVISRRGPLGAGIAPDLNAPLVFGSRARHLLEVELECITPALNKRYCACRLVAGSAAAEMAI
jgi:hypothetical protein